MWHLHVMVTDGAGSCSLTSAMGFAMSHPTPPFPKAGGASNLDVSKLPQIHKSSFKPTPASTLEEEKGTSYDWQFCGIQYICCV